MKSILFLSLLLCSLYSKAQNFSNWISDGAKPGLQVRYKITKDAQNYNYITLQVKSNNGCRMQITADACNKDGKDKNGWKTIQLAPDQARQYSFKIMNSCNNGFWWWYKDYESTAVKIDDN